MDGDSSDTSLALGIGRANPDVHGGDGEKVIKFHVLFPPKKSESEKRKSEELSEEEEEMEDEVDNRNGRKKLKLTLEQSSLLEQSFREQRTLSPVRICLRLFFSSFSPLGITVLKASVSFSFSLLRFCRTKSKF